MPRSQRLRTASVNSLPPSEANDARKRDAEKTPVQDGKKPTTQNGGRAQGDGSSDLKPDQEKGGKSSAPSPDPRNGWPRSKHTCEDPAP